MKHETKISLIILLKLFFLGFLIKIIMKVIKNNEIKKFNNRKCHIFGQFLFYSFIGHLSVVKLHGVKNKT